MDDETYRAFERRQQLMRAELGRVREARLDVQNAQRWGVQAGTPLVEILRRPEVTYADVAD